MAGVRPGITLLESDATRNDDWITDHSGDPDYVDLTKYNVSSRIDILDRSKWKVNNLNTNWQTKIGEVSFPSDITVATPFGENTDAIMLDGWAESMADANYIDDFIKEHNNLADKRIYLVINAGTEGTGSYKTFKDGDRVSQKYARGYVKGKVDTITAPFSNHYPVRIMFIPITN